MKQAIARNLNDPALVAAPIIPTDRVSIEELPEEKQPVEDLVQTAFKQRPELEQAVLTLKNDRDRLEGREERAAADARCLCVLWRQRTGRRAKPELPQTFSAGGPCPPNSFPTSDTAHAIHLFNSSGAGQGRRDSS